MGRLFVITLEGSIYSCKHCKTHLALADHILSKYNGGADMMKQLHENGELTKILKGLPVRKPGYVCETCGDARFFPCSNCSASKKVFDEDDDQLKRCPECNENGLIRCPTCCCS